MFRKQTIAAALTAAYTGAAVSDVVGPGTGSDRVYMKSGLEPLALDQRLNGWREGAQHVGCREPRPQDAGERQRRWASRLHV